MFTIHVYVGSMAIKTCSIAVSSAALTTGSDSVSFVTPTNVSEASNEEVIRGTGVGRNEYVMTGFCDDRVVLLRLGDEVVVGFTVETGEAEG